MIPRMSSFLYRSHLFGSPYLYAIDSGGGKHLDGDGPGAEAAGEAGGHRGQAGLAGDRLSEEAPQVLRIAWGGGRIVYLCKPK